MHFGLASFRLNVVHSRSKDMRMTLSIQLEASQLQRRFWRRWVDLFDEKQENEMATSTAIAYQCYNSNLMLKCFSALLEYCQWRQLRKAQRAQADAHFYLHITPKCLFHMKIYVQLERTCRQNAVTAECVYRDNVQRRVFTKWQSDARSIRDQRMLYRMAVLHHESVATRSFFSLWKEKAAEVEDERQKMLEAHRHHLYSLCGRVWDGWWSVVLERRQRETDYVKAVGFCNRRLKTESLKAWKQWMKEKKEKALKKEIADQHRRRCVFTVCVRAWKAVWAEGKRFQASAEGFLSRKHHKTVQLTFQEWKVVSEKLAITRKQKVAASIHFNRCLMLKVVQEWQQWAAIRAHKRSQTRQLLDQAVFQLQQLKLALHFKRWRGEMDLANQMSDKQNRADLHHRQVLQTKSLCNWKEHTRDCLRKRLLHGQSLKFNEVRLTAKHFFIWRARWAEKVEENSRTEMALWQWSLTLQRKVLLAWQIFKEHQKHKKCRLMEAASFRRQRLLEVACCQWLTTADSLAQVRASTAACYQTKAVMDSFRLVQKCAIHWKSWARRRAAAGDQDKRLKKTPTFPVTSKVRLTPNLIEFQNIPSNLEKRGSSWTNFAKPQTASISPARLVSSDGLNSHRSRQRRLPSRPSFLVESLQRAGLAAYMFADHLDGDTEQSESDSQSTLVADDELPNLSQSPERPTTGRFSPHAHSPSQYQRSRVTAQVQDYSDSTFSAEVLSGSTSTLGHPGQEVKPLYLDAEHSSSHTTSSLSPQLFTPSTQRSQFSGNPLLYSSPLSETGRSKPVTTRTEEGEGLFESYSDGRMVSGNLGQGTQGLQRLQFWEQDQQERQETKQTSQENGHDETYENKSAEEEPVVLLKPEYFMQKPPPKVEKKEKIGSSEEESKTKTKNTPRSFATWDTSIANAGGMFSDFNREGKGMLRHTPRELASPRRAPPPGILHNRASDSDVDVSPLNTARSRGTVTFASPKSPTPEEEIVSIRDRLKHFSQQKRKLRSLQKKYRLLMKWIDEQSKEINFSQECDDNESGSATEELDLVRLEVAQLQTIVDGQQPICEKLVTRAQTLAAQLNLPF